MGGPEAYAATEHDKARVVISTLGGGVKNYAIKSQINWDEVANIYGERFRNGTLYHYPGTQEYDDNDYYMSGETWLIAAGDVDDPGRVVAECMLKELREKDQNPESSIHNLYYNVSLGSYVQECDLGLLHRHGIVLAFHEAMRQVQEVGDVWEYLSSEEREEVENNIEPL